MTDSITHSTLSASSNLAPFSAMKSTHSGISKHSSAWLHNTSSMVFLADRTKSLTPSDHKSEMLLSLLRAWCVAKSRGKMLMGVVRFAKPFTSWSLVLSGSLENSEVHHPSPYMPTSARLDPLSRCWFFTSSAIANSNTRGARRAHCRHLQPPEPHFPPVIRSYSENSRNAWYKPCIISCTILAWISSYND